MHKNRLWQHISSHLRPNPYRRHFNAQNKIQLSQIILNAEQGHRGEIRLVVETQLPFHMALTGISARHRALQWFANLRMWDTEDNTGILLYLLLAEQKIEIIADRGIAKQVSQAQWDAAIADLRTQFKADQVIAGLSTTLQGFGVLLRTHFPLDGAQENPDELSNELVFIA